MNTKVTLLLATVLAAGSAAAQTDSQVNPRNPTDSRAFDVMEVDQGPPTATDRLYAKPRHMKHSKKHRSAENQPSGTDTSSMGSSGNTGATGSGNAPQAVPPVSQDLPRQPDRELAPDEPRVDR